MRTFAIMLLLSAPAFAQGDEKGFEKLCNGKDLSGWKFTFKDKDVDPAKTFAVRDGIVVCTGQPTGYMYTERTFKEFTLRLEYRYKRPDDLKDESTFAGNSGYLLFVQEHKVWPRSIEIQGMNRDVLGIIAIQCKAKFESDQEARLKARKPVGEWNAVEIVVKDGKITASLNGTLVSTVSEYEPKEGPIAFQSEGAEIHWRNIRIRDDSTTTIRGKLAFRDVEGGCWTLEDKDTTYDLHGDLQGCKHGDEVEVTGRVAKDKVCVHQVGTIFEVASIRRLAK
ncbi:MAG TPA: DUF1080 domain-containing protein [Planctomycetota bacterium]|nr:DUF1080 domain-containing protein [Planctomycetota bacterium]